MDPTTVCCPNLACHARGHVGQGNIGLPARKDQRCICTPCRQTFTATKGTAVYRVRTSAEPVTRVVTLLAHGWPLQAMGIACGCDARTGARWGARAGVQGQTGQEHRVEHPRDLGPVHADELRVKTHGSIGWMALALLGRTRVWRAGEGSAHRDMALIQRRMARVRRWAAPRRPLVLYRWIVRLCPGDS